MGLFRHNWEDSALALDYGRNGFDLIDNEFSEVTGRSYYAVAALETAEVTGTWGGTEHEMTIPAGMMIYGDLTAIYVGSGKLVGYIDDTGTGGS